MVFYNYLKKKGYISYKKTHKISKEKRKNRLC